MCARKYFTQDKNARETFFSEVGFKRFRPTHSFRENLL